MTIDAISFRNVISEIFNDLMSELGAFNVNIDEFDTTYQSKDWFVRVFSFPGHGSKREPRIEIGPLPSNIGFDRNKMFDILHTLPEDSPLKRYNVLWPYGSVEEMTSVFLRIRDEIFKQYAIPVLLNQTKLRALMNKMSKLNDQIAHDEITNHNDSVFRSKATAAYLSKNFSEYVENMEKISLDKLLKSDVAKLNFAKKRMRITVTGAKTPI